MHTEALPGTRAGVPGHGMALTHARKEVPCQDKVAHASPQHGCMALSLSIANEAEHSRVQGLLQCRFEVLVGGKAVPAAFKGTLVVAEAASSLQHLLTTISGTGQGQSTAKFAMCHCCCCQCRSVEQKHCSVH